MGFGMTRFVGGRWRDDIVETNDFESRYGRERDSDECGIQSLVHVVWSERKVENGGTGRCDDVERRARDADIFHGDVVTESWVNGVDGVG